MPSVGGNEADSAGIPIAAPAVPKARDVMIWSCCIAWAMVPVPLHLEHSARCACSVKQRIVHSYVIVHNGRRHEPVEV